MKGLHEMFDAINKNKYFYLRTRNPNKLGYIPREEDYKVLRWKSKESYDKRSENRCQENILYLLLKLFKLLAMKVYLPVHMSVFLV